MKISAGHKIVMARLKMIALKYGCCSDIVVDSRQIRCVFSGQNAKKAKKEAERTFKSL
jgi:hypothetical protein